MGYDKGPSFFFIANLMNFVLATGVFTLPFSIYESGLFLGSIILVITCAISVTACTFIIEALAMKNYLKKYEASVLHQAVDNTSDSLNDKQHFFSSEEDLKEEGFNTPLKKVKDQELITSEPVGSEKEKEEHDNYYIYKRYEISKLANSIMAKPLYFFVVLVMVCYLYVGVTSNGIIAGNSLLDIIGKTFNVTLPPYYYYIIVSVFFLITILIALNNINKLKQFSMFIMCCRFLIIILIMGCCLYSIFKYGPADISDIPKFEMSNITIMIGNSLFFFMSHHSIPGMVENFSPQKNLMKLLIIGYIVSLVIMLLYGFIALLAFSKPEYQCDTNVFPCAIQNVFSLNFVSVPWGIGYVINYYPIFNVITSAMQLITLRNNILQAIGGCSANLMNKLDFSQKNGICALLGCFVVNLFICIPPIAIALTLSNIQKLMKYFSSILGFLLMLVVPGLIVFHYRREFAKRKYPTGKLNKSFLQAAWGYFLIGTLAIAIFALIIYGFFYTNLKKCVAEKDAL